MKSELDLIKRIEAYLFEEMSDEEIAIFEKERKNDAALDHKVVAHLDFLKSIKAFGENKSLKAQMNLIHDELDIYALKKDLEETPNLIVLFWRKNQKSLSIAASVAIIATVITVLAMNLFNGTNQTSNYSELKRDMETIKSSQNALIRNINSKNQPKDISQYGGTGFAISANGYLVTNYHVIKDADSVYVQNNKGDSFKSETIYIDPSTDIAILQITDPSFQVLSTLPYVFKKSGADLGEDVFTIGYPKDDIVYGKGYLSSSTGFGGDSIAYQVTIPVNPGNSGGPLMDNKGNIIGIISGKQTQADGAAFAVKSDFLLKAFENIPQDSLKSKISLSKKNSLSGLSRKQQIKKLQDFIFIVKVYN